jgi:hypothetical protein
MQENYGFPVGLLLGANSRAWRASEVEQWLDCRPTEPSPHVLERAEKSKRARQAAVMLKTARAVSSAGESYQAGTLRLRRARLAEAQRRQSTSTDIPQNGGTKPAHTFLKSGTDGRSR